MLVLLSQKIRFFCCIQELKWVFLFEKRLDFLVSPDPGFTNVLPSFDVFWIKMFDAYQDVIVQSLLAPAANPRYFYFVYIPRAASAKKVQTALLLKAGTN